MAKPITIIFCEKDYQSASQLAGQLRTGANHVHLCMATGKTIQVEDAAEVLVMPDVSARSQQEIFRIYPNAKHIVDKPPLKASDADNVVPIPVIPLPRRRGRPPKIRAMS